MNLSDYTFLYNAAAYFAARERFGAAERERVDALIQSTDEAAKRTPEYKAELERLQRDAERKGFAGLLSSYSAAGFDALCWGVAELSNQGEIYHRYLGREPRKLLSVEQVRVALSPAQVSTAKGMIMAAIVKGIKAPDENGVEVDEVLEENQKKTVNS